MREMVLNHSSVSNLDVSEHTVLEWFGDLVRGMSILVVAKVAAAHIRAVRSIYEISCTAQYSFGEISNQKNFRAKFRDEAVFFNRLATKMPLLDDVQDDVVDRFRGCEGRILDKVDSDPLIFCIITDGISVGFPSLPVWNKDRLLVEFDELRSDGAIRPVFGEIDQLTKMEHADSICDRHIEVLAEKLTPYSAWTRRHEFLGNLILGPSIENDLVACANNFETIFRKLRILDKSVERWRSANTPFPVWGTLVSPESTSRMQDPKFRQSRTFLSFQGTREVFEWHARFGDSRIHFRIDYEVREVEIGYIGPHLPL